MYCSVFFLVWAMISLLSCFKVAEKKVDQIVFDRGASKFHGRVKAFADSARENGLKF